MTVTLICHENYLFLYHILIRTCNAFVFRLIIKCYISSDISEDMQITRLVTQE